MIWFVFALVTAGIVAVIIWGHRKKSAAREAARQERLERILDPKSPAAAPTAEEIGQRAAESLAEAAPKLPAASVVERFLHSPERLAYLLLRTGMPDHEVFAQVSLSAIVSHPGTGIDREQHRRRLSRYQVDFVICDREMRIVAVVDLESPGKGEALADRQAKGEVLQAAGVRVVKLDPTALPRRDALRALVRGG